MEKLYIQNISADKHSVPQIHIQYKGHLGSINV